MNQSDFGQLLIFHSIVQEKSITNAAKKLGITVPSVSKALKTLERNVGIALFVRTTRKLQLTDAGEQLYSQTREPISRLQNTWQHIGDQYQQPSGLVRITLSQLHFELIFKPFYAEFCARYPKIILEFSINNASVDLIEAGFDLGVRFGNNLTDNVVAKPIYPAFRQGLYISLDYASKYGIPKTLDDLQYHRMIGFRFMSSNRIEPLFLQINGENKLQPIENTLIFNDSEQVLDATLQGLGIGRIFEPLATNSALVPVLEEYWITFPANYLYYLPTPVKAKKIQLLIDFLMEKVGSYASS